MHTLDHALDRLLHDRDLRARFIAGEVVFELDDDDRAALACVDGAQLDAMGALVRDDVWRRAHRGVGTLEELFRETVAAWQARHPDDARCERMLEHFVASPSFERHRAVPHAGVGWSVEAAFCDWCATEGVGDAETRERELLAAMARVLTVCPEPDFEVPREFHRVGAGWYAVSSLGPPTLYAALRARYMTGPITPLVAALLRREETVEAIALRHEVDPRSCEPVVAELGALGLID